MRIIYTYDVSGMREKRRKFFVEFDSNKITFEELEDILRNDGATLNPSSELMYFNKSVNSFCTFPQYEPLEEPEELLIQIKRGYSISANMILSDIDLLEKKCEETENKIEERQKKRKSMNTLKTSISRVPCKELDIVMLYASPLVNKSESFESPSLNFLKEKEVLIQKIDKNAIARFEIATPENIKELFEYHSPIVIISCEALVKDNIELVLAVEKFDNISEIGELSEMSENELKDILAGNRFNQIIIVKSKKFEEVGQIFINIGFSIVLAVEDKDDATDSMLFIAKVINELLSGNTIEEIQEDLFQDIEPSQPRYKFLYTDESIKEQKFFLNEKKGVLEVVSDTYSLYKPPTIHKLAVGRRKEMKELISLILNHKCINVTGLCGIGKTMVLKRTAQYLYERRVFKDGIVYLDICMRTDMIFLYRYLAIIMSIPLADQLSIADDEKILSTMNFTEILLIIDNIDRLDNKEKIKSDIVKIISGTDKPKFIIGSQDFLEIKDVYNYELPLLTQKQSKALLQTGNEQYSDDIDSIVEKVGHNPADLLQFSPLLQQKFPESLSKYPESKYFSIETSISYMKKSFPNFLTFIKLLSYMPSGACDLNIKALCSNLIENYAEILESLKIDKKGYWFIHSDDNFKFVLLRSNVMNYLNYQIPHDPKLAKICLVHLGVYARAILKAFLRINDPVFNQYRGSLMFINAGIDTGIWGPCFVEESQKMFEEIQKDFSDVNKMFEKIESNFWYYLNGKLLKDMLGLENNVLDDTCSKALGEIILCTTSIFILMGKNEDALIMISRGRDLSNHFNLEKINALLLLTRASMHSSKKFDKTLEKNLLYSSRKYEKAKSLAEKAKKYFLNKEEAGLAECSFLIALIRFKMKKSSNSMNLLKKVSSTLVEEDAEMDLVIIRFKNARQELGCARAQLGYSKYMLKKGNDLKINDYLTEAIKVFDEHKFYFWKTKAQLCLFKWYFKGSNWTESRKILNGIDRTQQEVIQVVVDKLLHKVNENIKKTNKHAISFFFSAPLVQMNNLQLMKTKPLWRINNEMIQQIQSSLVGLSKEFCLRSEVLSRANFQNCLEDRPMILHLASCGVNNTHIFFEADQGVADLISFQQFSELCGDSLKKYGVELLVLAMPLSKKFASYCYKNLQIRHVVGFQLFDYTDENCPTQVAQTLEIGIKSFCVEFYIRLLQGKSVKESFLLARSRMDHTVQKELRIFGEISVQGCKFIQYWESVKDNEPVLVDFESDEHEFYLLTTDIPCGEPVIMSLPFGPCDIVREGKFVGRQVEMHKVLQGLKQTNCVLVEGEDGIGKTDFVKQVGIYLNLRHEYTDRISYLDIKGKSSLEEINQRLHEIGIRVYSGYFIERKKKNKKILLILDNCDDFFTKSSHAFFQLLELLMTEWKISVILTGKTRIKPPDSLKIVRQQLGKLSDTECKALITLARPCFFAEFYINEDEKQAIELLFKKFILESKKNPGELMKLLANFDRQGPTQLLKKINLVMWLKNQKGYEGESGEYAFDNESHLDSINYSIPEEDDQDDSLPDNLPTS